ncbi:unnamed protein product [Microthlaspi erraticum]|uniref:Uncharacterized protein n=1 Tax=Microthlaspi erraticum TaxID=1685480 RepID=A0A6D2I760_9BRAS|nr:unnamed protein product [Microthlaspi erraticum]
MQLRHRERGAENSVLKSFIDPIETFTGERESPRSKRTRTKRDCKDLAGDLSPAENVTQKTSEAPRGVREKDGLLRFQVKSLRRKRDILKPGRSGGGRS